MSESLEAFRQRVWGDEALQRDLRGADTAEALIERTVALGRVGGYTFTPEEVQSLLQAAQRRWLERRLPGMLRRSAVTDVPADNFAALDNWLPVLFDVSQGKPIVEWCHFGDERLTEPFYTQSIHGQLSLPFNHLFRRRTSIEALSTQAEQGLKPSGLIFHMSRCGSTLITQLLRALPENLVLSEPEPFDAALRSCWKMPGLTDGERIQWLRSMAGALGQPRHGEQQLFIKLDAWHMLEWRLIEQAFPGVPWIFLYRDPVEVMVSHARWPGSHMVPGIIESTFFGWRREDVMYMPSEEYCALVLSAICRAAIEAMQGSAHGRLMNYTELPDVVWQELPAHFGLSLSPAQMEQMQNATIHNAKHPQETFAPDSADKQAEASEPLRLAANQELRPLYEELETLRLA